MGEDHDGSLLCMKPYTLRWHVDVYVHYLQMKSLFGLYE